VKVPAACGDHIPAGVAGRAPTADKLAHDTAVLLEARMTVAAHCRRWRLVALTLLALSVAGCGTIDLCDHSGLGDPPGGSSIPHTPR